MRMSRRSFPAAWLGIVLLAGCSGSDSADTTVTATPDAVHPGDSVAETPERNEPRAEQGESATGAIRRLPPASLDRNKGEPAAPSNSETPDEPAEKGTPEWVLQEIARIRLQPLVPTEGTRRIDAAQVRKALAERNRKIVQLATEALKLTHNDPQKQRAFDLAVHYLMESQLQLALQGDEQARDDLFADAEFLMRHKPGTKAAVECAFAVTEYSRVMAERFADRDPRWIHEFARQARLFATRFPEAVDRAVPMLFAAGRSCEIHGFREEAITCFQMLVDRFPLHAYAQEAIPILRRLRLPGQPPQLAGPTIDGGYVSVDKYQGRPVLIVFWASDAEPFVRDWPAIQKAIDAHRQKGLVVLGVNLDEEEPAVDAFLEEHPLDWPQIFFSEREKRGWNNPLAAYYGIRELPSLWLIDRNGKVVSVLLKPAQLAQALAEITNAEAESRKPRVRANPSSP